MPRRLAPLILSALAAAAGGAATADAAPFTNGDVVVYRVGDGSAALTNASTAVFLDEFSPAGALVQSVALPTAINGSNFPLTASGSATSEGQLTRSSDGRYLVAPGYGIAPGTANVAGTTSAATPRVIGEINSAGTIDTTTALSDAASGNNPRGAASTDGTNLYITGGAGGIRLATRGATTSTSISTTVANLRVPNIFGGQLYVSDSSGTTNRLGTVGTGTPTTTGQTLTNLPGFSTNTGSPYGFYFTDLSVAVPGLDTLYVADDAAGIQKWSYDGSTWTLTGVTGTPADGYRGLTGFTTVSGLTSTVTLYSATATKLVSVTDTAGYNVAPTMGTPTTLATAPTNEAFRGVALAPVANTGVAWRSGKARTARRSVVVSWRTGLDADAVSYAVVRDRKGHKQQLTRLSARSGKRGRFSFRDASGRAGDTYYVVERLADGRSTTHGPFVARKSTHRKAAR